MKITVKNTVATSITALVTTVFVWWGMHFPGLTPPSATANTYPIDCSPTPSPTPISDTSAALSNLLSGSNNVPD